MELEGAVGEVANVVVEEQAEQAQIAQAQAQQAAEGGHTYTELRALCAAGSAANNTIRTATHV